MKNNIFDKRNIQKIIILFHINMLLAWFLMN